MKLRLKAHLDDIANFEKDDPLIFKLDENANNLNLIKESIMSIQDNLKYHINMFKSMDGSKVREWDASVSL